MKTFGAPWGKLLVVVSLGVTVLCGSVALLRWLIPPLGQNEAIIGWLLWLPLLLIPCCALSIVRGYSITSGALLIHRPFRDTRISLADLRSAEAKPNAMRGSIRTFGNGGFYSITGWYWSRSLRSYRAFVTDLNRTVVLTFRTRTVVVSPDDPEGFVRQLNETCGR